MSGYVLEMKCADPFLENHKVDGRGFNHARDLLDCCLANRGRVIR